MGYHATAPGRHPLVSSLFWRAVASYVLFGMVTWNVEWLGCDALLPYYQRAGGLTFHIVWHIGAAVGAYLFAQQMIAMRLVAIGQTPALVCCFSSVSDLFFDLSRF